MPQRLRKLKKFWSAIELLPQWCAVRAEWRWLLGPEFDLIAGRLKPTGRAALSYPHLTADGYDTPYRVVRHDDGHVVGVARDKQTLRLTRDDVDIHDLSPRDLLREIGTALGLDVEPAKLDGMPGTWQIGSVLKGASERRPAFFTCATEKTDIRRVVEHLTARHQEPFVLLVPTPSCLDSASLSLLETRRAAVVVLQDVLGLDDRGRWCGLQPTGRFLATIGTAMSAPADRKTSRVPDDPYKWARQAELARATNQVLSDERLDPGVLSRACRDREITTNGKSGRGSLVEVNSFMGWLGKQRGVPKDELIQVRNAVIGEIPERKNKTQAGN